MLKKNWFTLIVLLAIFIILLIVGRAFALRESEENPIAQSATTTSQDTTNAGKPASKTTAAAVSSSPIPTDTQASCAQNLQVNTEKNHTQYDSTTVLIGFPSTLSFNDALNLAFAHQVAVQNQSDAAASYPSTHVITGTVPDGTVFEKICELKQDARIRYAGINPIMNLHE